MSRFVVVDGAVFEVDDRCMMDICDYWIEASRSAVRFAPPSWECGFKVREKGMSIPIELLEEYYEMMQKKVERKNKLSVIPGDEGILLKYGGIELELNKVDLEDFIGLCEVLLEEKEDVYAVCAD